MDSIARERVPSRHACRGTRLQAHMTLYPLVVNKQKRVGIRLTNDKVNRSLDFLIGASVISLRSPGPT